MDQTPPTAQVVIRPGSWLTIQAGTTIRVREYCNSTEAEMWGLTNPGGGNAKPAIIIMPGAKLYAVGGAPSLFIHSVDLVH